MKLLGIETSCDETSVAVLEEDGTVRSNLIASQIERHRPFGGVVPEIASREHLEHLPPLVQKALEEAGISLDDISAVAVTCGPGLIGALLVGVAAAQGISYGRSIPLIAVNHLEGHIFSSWLQPEGPATPLPSRFLSLVVSGGHSSIYDVRPSEARDVRMLNKTKDDAAGEVFDKVAKFIGLPYPGGPQVEKLAREGDASRYQFFRPQARSDSLDFSFSGLKSSAIRLAREEGLAAESEDSGRRASAGDFCASFQQTVCDQIIDRLERVWQMLGSEEGPMPAEMGLAGGVAANGALRQRIESWGAAKGLTIRLAQRRFCTDNAAMIAFAGLQKLRRGEIADPRRVAARSRLPAGM